MKTLLLRISRILQTPIPIRALPRWAAHLAFWAVAWPLLTAAGTAATIMELPYYSVLLRDAIRAALVGTALRLPDLMLVGCLLFGLSWGAFGYFGASPRPGRWGALRLAVEPVVTFTALVACVAVWYPGILSQPLFMLVASVPAAGVLALLAAGVVLGVLITGQQGKRLRLLAVLAAAGLASPLPAAARSALQATGGAPPSIILLGVDSLSHTDDLGPLSTWVEVEGGTWYERAVTPGLFTNAVWASILTMQPVREHGVFHTFQHLADRQPQFLVAARAAGFRTIAIFPDQLTCAVGSRTAFDEDRSGPVGWRQLLLPMVANSSIFVPVLAPVLPRPWRGSLPSNEAGTFTYDIRQEIRSLLRAGTPGQPTLVATHLTYPHLPAYPGSFELTWGEWKAVLRAPAGKIRDKTIDWGFADWIDDPIPLRQWKVRRIQELIADEVGAAQYLESGGRLIVFSDHGSRSGMSMKGFGDHRYHHVVLATFGLPARCPSRAVSLIDLGALLGLTARRSEPSVEFTFAAPAQWPALAQSVRLHWRGDVDLDADLLAEVFAELRRHDPWRNDEAGSPACGAEVP
jgi:hypothetical protein